MKPLIVHPEVIESDVSKSLCLNCSIDIEDGDIFCDKCFNELEDQGYFAPPSETFDNEE